MGIWKTLREEKPKELQDVIVLTKDNKIQRAFYSEENRCFYPSSGLFVKLQHKRWCYEKDLIEYTLYG